MSRRALAPVALVALVACERAPAGRGVEPPPPVVDTAPAATVDAAVPSSDQARHIHTVIGADVRDFLECYKAELQRQPGLGGVVRSRFTIEPDGTVSSAEAVGVHPAVAGCIAGVLLRLRFPEITTRSVVNYPFAFSPSVDAGVPDAAP